MLAFFLELGHAGLDYSYRNNYFEAPLRIPFYFKGMLNKITEVGRNLKPITLLSHHDGWVFRFTLSFCNSSHCLAIFSHGYHDGGSNLSLHPFEAKNWSKYFTVISPFNAQDNTSGWYY